LHGTATLLPPSKVTVQSNIIMTIIMTTTSNCIQKFLCAVLTIIGTISAPIIPQTNKDCFSDKTMLETAVYYYIVESCSFNSECAVGTTWGWLIGN